MTPAAELHPRPLRPTDVLKHEHRRIEERLSALSAALETLGERGSEPAILDRIEEIARRIDREMALHHRKEEEGLFPILAPYLDEHLNLDGRVADHEDLNIMSGKFKAAIEECRGAPANRFAAQMLRGYGLYIVHLVLEHLLKEDQILFLVAEHSLSAEEEAEVFRRFRRIDGPQVDSA
jgi:hemerythrin-like domain-containing protein